MSFLRVMAFASCLVTLASCSGGVGQHAADSTLAARSQSVARLRTVGDAGYRNKLTMSQIQRWYAVLAMFRDSAERDPTFRLKLNFPLDSSLASQVRAVEARSSLRAAIAGAGLTSDEFVMITASYGGAKMAIQLRDSLSHKDLPTNVNPANVSFLDQHAKEIRAIAYVP
jgi:hypothetical protein